MDLQGKVIDGVVDSKTFHPLQSIPGKSWDLNVKLDAAVLTRLRENLARCRSSCADDHNPVVEI